MMLDFDGTSSGFSQGRPDLHTASKREPDPQQNIFPRPAGGREDAL